MPTGGAHNRSQSVLRPAVRNEFNNPETQIIAGFNSVRRESSKAVGIKSMGRNGHKRNASVNMITANTPSI